VPIAIVRHVPLVIVINPQVKAKHLTVRVLANRCLNTAVTTG